MTVLDQRFMPADLAWYRGTMIVLDQRSVTVYSPMLCKSCRSALSVADGGAIPYLMFPSAVSVSVSRRVLRKLVIVGVTDLDANCRFENSGFPLHYLHLKTWISDATFTRISASIFLLICSSASSALMLSFATSCAMRGSSGSAGIVVQSPSTKALMCCRADCRPSSDGGLRRLISTPCVAIAALSIR